MKFSILLSAWVVLTATPLFSTDIQDINEKARSGDAEAQYQLARSLESGKGVTKDPAAALEWMRKAAAQGQVEAQGGVGYYYAVGLVVPKDEIEALQWFRKGAELGSLKAKLNVGIALSVGKGAPTDEKEALRLIGEAADGGLPEAEFTLGEIYFWGKYGVNADLPKAFKLFHEAAVAGHMAAANNVGAMLRDGQGTKMDEAEAIVWFRKAAEAGIPKAQCNLGHLIGFTSEDQAKRIESLKWLILASNKNQETASKTLNEAQPSLKQEDLAAATKLAEEFEAQQAAKSQGN